jgi:hypothetical protein
LQTVRQAPLSTEHPINEVLFKTAVHGPIIRKETGCLDLGLHGGELVGLAAGDHDMRAQRRDLVRRAAADAAAAAGDDDGLALKQPRLEDRAVRHVSSDDLNGRLSACI